MPFGIFALGGQVLHHEGEERLSLAGVLHLFAMFGQIADGAADNGFSDLDVGG